MTNIPTLKLLALDTLNTNGYTKSERKALEANVPGSVKYKDTYRNQRILKGIKEVSPSFLVAYGCADDRLRELLKKLSSKKGVIYEPRVFLKLFQSRIRKEFSYLILESLPDFSDFKQLDLFFVLERIQYKENIRLFMCGIRKATMKPWNQFGPEDFYCMRKSWLQNHYKKHQRNKELFSYCEVTLPFLDRDHTFFSNDTEELKRLRNELFHVVPGFFRSCVQIKALHLMKFIWDIIHDNYHRNYLENKIRIYKFKSDGPIEYHEYKTHLTKELRKALTDLDLRTDSLVRFDPERQYSENQRIREWLEDKIMILDNH